MEVTVQHQVTLLFHSFDELFSVEDGGMELLAGVNPLTVQINTSKITSVVPIDHTIDVQHRHNLEDKVLAENLRDWRIAHQEVDDVFDEVTCHALSRVHS